MTASTTVVGESSAARLDAAYARVKQRLLDERNAAGHWTGELSSSALSTATAVSALAIVDRERSKRQVAGLDREYPRRRSQLLDLLEKGVKRLVELQNADGGWGDTDKSFSNIATTMLADAAFRLAGVEKRVAQPLEKAGAYLDAQGRVAGLVKRYGKDKTFSVPILTNCALAGQAKWSDITPLPFEMACLPRSLLGAMQLPVVSYALPALIAIGQARYFHRPPGWWNPIMRLARGAAVAPSLRKLTTIQPESGGFLEATPLTSFVVMSLASIGQVTHPVVEQGVQFLIDSVRPDGSWPIDTNLATWTTTLSLNALAAGGEAVDELPCLDWVLSCQHRVEHPYTGAAPGAWAWTDLSGGVPDADDTPGALLALANVRHAALRAKKPLDSRWADAAGRGVRWLLQLQNDDGGWPTFCRGWGTLPFDRSGTDLTAHAIRAIHSWIGKLAGEGASPKVAALAAQFDKRCQDAIERGFKYLAKTQRADGGWLPLWFGNQHHPEEENPVYGTSRVLLAYR
ncbi:MAG TPA: prenyltransferase/squalene oxidase repeat-containing protein, partial [Pirellulales bacterium]